MEGLLAVLRRRRKVSGLVQVRGAGRRKFQNLGAATLKLRSPNEVRTNGAEEISVGESERMSRMTRMNVGKQAGKNTEYSLG